VEQLRGRNALITGAAGGLGEYISRALAAEGVNLVLSDLPEAPLEDLVSELRDVVKVESVPADLCDRGEPGRLAERAEEALAPLDILVNGAGLEFAGPFLERSPDEIAALTQVNLLSTMLLTRAVLPGMLERGRGHVVNIASLAGKAAFPFLATYSASKHGVVGFTHALRGELGDEQVGFSAICPGFVARVGMYGRLEGQAGKPPPPLSPVQPEQVGEAVVKAIRENRSEVIVNGPGIRLLIFVAIFAPRLAARLGRSRRNREFAERFARAKEATPPSVAEQRLKSSGSS